MSEQEEKKLAKHKAKLLDPLVTTKNRCLSQFNFGKIDTFADLLHHAGLDSNDWLSVCSPEYLTHKVTRSEVARFFDKYIYEKSYEIDNNTTYSQPPFPEAEYEGYPSGGRIEIKNETKIEEENNSDNDDIKPDELLPLSPLIKCKLYPFQDRAAKKLVDNIILGKRGQLLRAEVGVGKTYIIGRVIRHLLDINFLQGKTFSPWPVAYITKATVVEQTKRVLHDAFGIDIVNEVCVINIEQLRSQFGSLMVKDETVVTNGKEHIIWRWRKNIHPCLFFLDECQVVKNTDSTQSKIIQAIANIDDKNIYSIFFSATPFLRVSEAKAFVVNCRLSTNGFGTKIAIS